MKKFEKEQEPTLKYKSGKISMATTAVLEDWKPTTILCPKCGGKHTAFNTMCVLTTYPEQYQYICSDCGHRWTGFEANKIPPVTNWPDLEPAIAVEPLNYGWICPKCGRVYSPTTSQCLFCGGAYSPNIVYCGPNNGTKAVYDTITMSNTIDNSKANATQNTQSNNLKYESFMKQHGE